jgi:acyl-CoA dehydrogenase
MDVPFPNGTLEAQNLRIPLDAVIGGEENAGNGWRMLMECLAVGRSISLPACAVGSAKVDQQIMLELIVFIENNLKQC